MMYDETLVVLGNYIYKNNTGFEIKKISWLHFCDGCKIFVAKLKTVNGKIATAVEVLVAKGNI
mgnify:CR=1 FL=1